jgi:transcriptional regulator with XRE-family HTH domain
MKNKKTLPLDKSLLERECYASIGNAFNSMLQVYDKRALEEKLNQDKLAALLDVNKSLISRRLKGSENITFRILSFMATAMNCKLKVIFQPYEDIRPPNYQFGDLKFDQEPTKTTYHSRAKVQNFNIAPAGTH